jgi:hypothetical protein
MGSTLRMLYSDTVSVNPEIFACFAVSNVNFKATLYSMLSFQGWWRQCTRSYLEAARTHCWRQRHSATALAMYAMTLVTAWMPWRRNVDLLVPAGKHSSELNSVAIRSKLKSLHLEFQSCSSGINGQLGNITHFCCNVKWKIRTSTMLMAKFPYRPGEPYIIQPSYALSISHGPGETGPFIP